MSGTEKRVVVYTDERLAELGHRLRHLREQEVAIKREIADIEAEQHRIFASMPPAPGVVDENLRSQFFTIFNAAMNGTDPVVLSMAYDLCTQHRNVVQSWRSPHGEYMWIAYQRRMDEIGGSGKLDEIVAAKKPKFERWSIIGCGDRNWPASQIGSIQKRFAKLPDTTRLIHGGNGYRDPDGKLRKGADLLCDRVAKRLGWPPPKEFPYLGHLGKAGGPARNQQMLTELLRRRDEDGDRIMVIAFHPNLAQSTGTQNMLMLAAKAGVPFEVVAE